MDSQELGKVSKDTGVGDPRGASVEKKGKEVCGSSRREICKSSLTNW